MTLVQLFVGCLSSHSEVLCLLGAWLEGTLKEFFTKSPLCLPEVYSGTTNSIHLEQVTILTSNQKSTTCVHWRQQRSFKTYRCPSPSSEILRSLFLNVPQGILTNSQGWAPLNLGCSLLFLDFSSAAMEERSPVI